MAGTAQNAVLNYDRGAVPGKLEELHLTVPKGVANDFRQVAKRLRMKPNALFEEMVEIYKTTV